jgi:glycine cleavage system T protein (aminomethyltransferase)
MTGLKQTPLFNVYKDTKARLVDFGGWELPVQFSGIKDEHLSVREKAGIFDVSHMGEIRVKGAGALNFIQRAACNDASRLSPGKSQYSALLNEKGGFVDDIFIYMLKEEDYLICVNASNTDTDYKWLCKMDQPDCEVKNESQNWAQIALQGPVATKIFHKISDLVQNSVDKLCIAKARVEGVDVLAARTGYTGEDGFEIFVPSEKAVTIWQTITDAGKSIGLVPCGLGARDTLRLEMGYPLHGHDISPDLTALEADLSWIVALSKDDFVGKKALLKQKNEGVTKKRVGFILDDPGIARDGYKIIASSGEGIVTSGTKTPCLEKAIGMGYVPVADSEDGSPIEIEIRGKLKKARVSKWPFYKK